MAARIGVARRWHQKADSPHSHYDICMSKRAIAVQLGAVEINREGVVAVIRAKRASQFAIKAAGLRTLTIPAKALYFDQMQSGEKPFDYRLRTPYWSKRLIGREYDRLVMTRGYPRADDTSRRLELPWRGYEEQTIVHPHFGRWPVPVFAIVIDVGTRDR